MNEKRNEIIIMKIIWKIWIMKRMNNEENEEEK